MGSFNWDVDGQDVRIVFSLIRNAKWLDTKGTGRRDAIVFDYLDYDTIVVSLADLDIEESEYDRELWTMLLQVTGLDAT
jgi:hypothetical protein